MGMSLSVERALLPDLNRGAAFHKVSGKASAAYLTVHKKSRHAIGAGYCFVATISLTGNS